MVFRSPEEFSVTRQTKNFDVSYAEEQAYKRSVTWTTVEVTDYLVRIIGPQMTAVGAGVKDVRTVRTWQDGTEPRTNDFADRLRALVRVVTMIEETYGAHAARAFLRGSNTTLMDEAPLVVMGRATSPDDFNRILNVVRGFLME